MILLPLAIAASVAGAAPPADDTWVYGEASNYCMAFFRQSTAQLVIRLSAKTGDDTIQIWRRGLPSLTKGMNKREKATAEARHFDLSLVIADRAIPLTAQTGNLRPQAVPGIAYVLGVEERSFVDALAAGGVLEVRRGGIPVASYRIADHATLASRLSACAGTQ